MSWCFVVVDHKVVLVHQVGDDMTPWVSMIGTPREVMGIEVTANDDLSGDRCTFRCEERGEVDFRSRRDVK